MDYMNLGVTSRKTGIEIKKGIRKDEFSMENVEEFFKDEESYISVRRKSRKSSLLPFSKQILPQELAEPSRRSSNVLPPSVPTINEEHDEELNGGDAYELPDEAQDFDASIQNYSSPPRDRLKSSQGERVQRRAGLDKQRYEPNYKRDDESIHDVAIPQTPPSDYGNESYRDVPDLVADEDDELSRGNTTFNTSDNALLEDELHQGRVIQSEEDEDRDYFENPSEDSKGSSSEGEDLVSDASSITTPTLVRTNNKSSLLHYAGVDNRNKPEARQVTTDDSDEDFIQEQAHALAKEAEFSRPNGLRKSNRVKIAPLEYWRNEKIIYKRKSTKPVLEIDKVITYEHDDDDDEEEEKMRRKKRPKNPPYNFSGSGKSRGRPRKNQQKSGISPSDKNLNESLLSKARSGQVQHSEWLEQGVLRGPVKLSSDQRLEGEENLAYAPNMAQSEQHRVTEEEKYSLAVLFQTPSTLASGILTLPIGCRKKIAKSNNAFINFYLIQGVIEASFDWSQ